MLREFVVEGFVADTHSLANMACIDKEVKTTAFRSLRYLAKLVFTFLLQFLKKRLDILAPGVIFGAES